MTTGNGFQLQFYESVMRSMPIGALALNSELVIVSMNPAAEMILGIASAEAAGYPLERLLRPQLGPGHAGALADALRAVARAQATYADELGLGQKIIALKASPLTDAQQAVMGVVLMLEDITERTRMEQGVQHRAEQLALLYDAGLTLNRVLDLKAQLQAIFAIALQAVQAERADFFTFDPASQTLQVGLTHHYANAEVPPALQKLVFAVGEHAGVVGSVAARREMFYLPDVTTDPRWIVVDPEIRSALWVPLEYEQRLLGVMCISSTRPNAFPPDDQRLLEMFARQAAVALEKTRLFGEIQQHLAELEAVNQATNVLRTANTLDEVLARLLNVTMAALHAERGQLRLYDKTLGLLAVAAAEGYDGSAETRPLLPGEGLAGQVFATGEPFVGGEGCAGAEALDGFVNIVAPLRAGDALIGTFTIDRAAPCTWLPSEIALFNTLSEIGGGAIQRDMLRRQTEQRLQHLSASRDISRAITGSFDLRVNLAVVLTQAVAQLEIPAALVLMFNPKSNLLEFAAARGFRSKLVENIRLRLGESHAGQAALERRIVQIKNLAEPGGRRISPLLLEEGFVSYIGVPLIAKGQVKGVLEVFSHQALDPDEEWRDFLQALAGQAAIAIDNATLFNDLQRSNFELTQAYDATIEGWSRALDLRDKETEGHTQRVTEMALRLARACGVRDTDLMWIRWGALLHDIGKIGIPDAILHKPGPLTEAERLVVRQHPTYAYDLLAPIQYLRAALDIPYGHHERWDGAGYPQGLRGEEIPLAARIFAVVDVWDALRSKRAYHPAWSHEALTEHLRKEAGKHFDPKITETFLALLKADEAAAHVVRAGAV